MKKFVFVLSIVLIFVFTVGLYSGEAIAKSDKKVIKWRLAGGTPPNDIGYEGVVEFCKNVKERSNGRLVITPYPANQLCKAKDNFQATKKGMVEAMYSPGSYWSGILPEANWETGLPYTTLERSEEIALMFDYGLLDLLREAYAEHNMHYLIPTPTGQRGFMSNKPIRTIEDYKGLKARCTGPEADLLRELGGSPVFMTGGEIYTALELNTLDAASWTMMAWTHMNWKEVAKYYTLPRTANMIVALVLNMDAWKALPQDLKNIVEWSARDWILYCASHYREVEATQENNMEPGRMITLSESDQAKVQQAAFRVWDKIAAMSPRNAKAVEIIKTYLKKIGRIK